MSYEINKAEISSKYMPLNMQNNNLLTLLIRYLCIYNIQKLTYNNNNS